MGLRPTNNKVAGTKISRSGFPSPVTSSIFLFFFHLNAAAGICEMASSLVFPLPGRNAQMEARGIDPPQKKEPDCSGSMVIRLIRPHPGAQKGDEANYLTLPEPHH